MKYKIEVEFETETIISLEKMKEFIPYWIGEIERNWVPVQNLVTEVTEMAQIKPPEAPQLDIVSRAVDSI